MFFCTVSSLLYCVSSCSTFRHQCSSCFQYCLLLDQSAFKKVSGPSSSDGFRVYGAFAMFVYSQLQVILPDSFLGDISNWDHSMSIDLSSPDLPFKTTADLLKNLGHPMTEHQLNSIKVSNGLLSTSVMRKR